LTDDASGIVGFGQECSTTPDVLDPGSPNRDKGSPWLPQAPTNSRQIQHWGADLAHRIGIQEAGTWRAARIMQAVRGQGITFTVAQTWPNTGRDFERALKARKHASRFCPRCQGAAS
jgi:hypothetical protein